MENEQIEQSAPKRKKSSKFKLILILVLLALVLGAGAYGYFWIRSTQKARTEAQSVIKDAEQYNLLKEKIQSEKSRCENFISQKEGDFGSFEYCQKYIDWADAL